MGERHLIFSSFLVPQKHWARKHDRGARVQLYIIHIHIKAPGANKRENRARSPAGDKNAHVKEVAELSFRRARRRLTSVYGLRRLTYYCICTSI